MISTSSNLLPFRWSFILENKKSYTVQFRENVEVVALVGFHVGEEMHNLRWVRWCVVVVDLSILWRPLCWSLAAYCVAVPVHIGEIISGRIFFEQTTYTKIRFAPQRTESIFDINTKQMMQFRKIITVICENHTKHINVLRGQTIDFVNVTAVARTFQYRKITEVILRL
jgi:hypothetical protein